MDFRKVGFPKSIAKLTNGIVDGEEEEYYQNGQIAARRFFSRGKKVGTHQGWFRDGSRRFHAEYQEDQHHGEAWEWYNSGTLASYSKFKKGKCLGKKMWREDGAIYMNYVFQDGRPVGFPGAKLCFQVRDPKSQSETTQ